MQKKFLIGGGVIAAVTVAAAVAIAAPGSMGHGPMHKMDSDGDGAVSKAEALAMVTTHFTKMDANSDGRIDVADRAAHHKAHFTELDTDKNGSISEAEFMAAHAKRADAREERREGRMDRGTGRHGKGHGYRGASMMMLKMADTNNDRAVTKAEMNAAVDAHFTKADTDKDGKISAAEGAAARKSMHERMKAQTAS
jgi:Ca2+-binding EF-hand superfamily protein